MTNDDLIRELIREAAKAISAMDEAARPQQSDVARMALAGFDITEAVEVLDTLNNARLQMKARLVRLQVIASISANPTRH